MRGESKEASVELQQAHAAQAVQDAMRKWHMWVLIIRSQADHKQLHARRAGLRRASGGDLRSAGMARHERCGATLASLLYRPIVSLSPSPDYLSSDARL